MPLRIGSLDKFGVADSDPGVLVPRLPVPWRGQRDREFMLSYGGLLQHWRSHRILQRLGQRESHAATVLRSERYAAVQRGRNEAAFDIRAGGDVRRPQPSAAGVDDVDCKCAELGMLRQWASADRRTAPARGVNGRLRVLMACLSLCA